MTTTGAQNNNQSHNQPSKLPNKKLQGHPGFSEAKVAIVAARFNPEVTEKLEAGAISYLNSRGVDQVVQVRVPGAFEIPLAAKNLLDQGFDGVVALGAVIRGDTAHFDYVCSAVERGCTQLQLDYGRPVAFGILTTDTDEQALDRAGGKLGNKGTEAAEVCMEMIDLGRQIRRL